MNSVTKLSSRQELEKFLNTHHKVVIDCYGDFCEPCKKIAPKYHQIATDPRTSSIAFAKVNVADDVFDDINAVPQFLFFYEGDRVDLVAGADTRQLLQKIKVLIDRC